MVDCMGENGVPGVPDCLGTCGLSERPAAFIPIEECTAVACPDGDGEECDTPADWKPPADTFVCEGSDASIGGGELADCGFDASMPFNKDGAVLQLQSEETARSACGSSAATTAPGSLANTNWTLLKMRVGPLGEVADIDGSTAGCWYSSHHNFRDWAHGWSGSRHYDVVLKEDGHGGARQ